MLLFYYMGIDNMKNKFNKAKFELWEVICISFFSSLVMSFCTGYLVYNGKSCSYDGDEYLAELNKAYNEIKSNYYSSVDLGALVDAGISGMFGYLGDPYTTYLDKGQTESLTNSLSGKYTGIGIGVRVSDDGVVSITKVYENTPAYDAGLLVGDVIVNVNGTEICNDVTTDISSIIKNSDDVNLIVNRDGNSLEFNLKSDSLYVPSVSSEVIDGVGYMAVSKFNESVFEQFEYHLNKLENSGISGLIIDLRGNTGGYLSSAGNIAELFLEKGKVIYSLNEQSITSVTKDETDESRTYKVYILTNGSTASASEILAAALRDSYGAIIVGSTTYGKGKVQKTNKLSDGTMYKYTSAKWLTPNGVCIDGVGLEPDISVDVSNEDALDVILNRALEEIKK